MYRLSIHNRLWWVFPQWNYGLYGSMPAFSGEPLTSVQSHCVWLRVRAYIVQASLGTRSAIGCWNVCPWISRVGRMLESGDQEWQRSNRQWGKRRALILGLMSRKSLLKLTICGYRIVERWCAATVDTCWNSIVIFGLGIEWESRALWWRLRFSRWTRYTCNNILRTLSLKGIFRTMLCVFTTHRIFQGSWLSIIFWSNISLLRCRELEAWHHHGDQIHGYLSITQK